MKTLIYIDVIGKTRRNKCTYKGFNSFLYEPLLIHSKWPVQSHLQEPMTPYASDTDPKL